MNNIVIISEFLPVHKGHEQALIDHISHDISDIFFCIDGAYRKLSDETPFSTKERENMIALLMQKHQLPYSILHLRDTDEYIDRKASIQKLLKPLSGATILSDTKEIYDITTSLGYDSKNIFSHTYIPGILRNQIASGHKKAVGQKIPHHILDYIENIDGYTRSKNFKNHLFHGPGVTVDVIARNKNGDIAIIDRAHEPFGKALIGGFIEIGDSGEDTSHKESNEESNLQGTIGTLPHQRQIQQTINNLLSGNKHIYPYEKQPFYVITDPQRDKRGHLITLGYILDVENADDIKAGDDAGDIHFMDPHEALNHPEIFADHKTIIAAYLAQL